MFERYLVYVWKISDFCDMVKSCGLYPTSAFIRISLDGRVSFFKVIINTFDCEEKNGLMYYLVNLGKELVYVMKEFLV